VLLLAPGSRSSLLSSTLQLQLQLHLPRRPGSLIS
jgi:hypothetical protein